MRSPAHMAAHAGAPGGDHQLIVGAEWSTVLEAHPPPSFLTSEQGDHGIERDLSGRPSLRQTQTYDRTPTPLGWTLWDGFQTLPNPCKPL